MAPARGRYVTRHHAGIAGAQTTAQRRGGQYRAFIPDAIALLEVSLPGALVAELERASTAVRSLNESPPKLAALEAVARHLLRQESTASSRIEGLALAHRRVALADFDPERSRDQKAADIAGNIRAMTDALARGDRAQPLGPEDVRAIHATLLRFGEDARLAGQLRSEQGWIGGSTPLSATYVPPPHPEVPRLLADLCGFANRDDVPALAQAAIVHAQFENIHPFADGNGRVGRCLIHTVLRRRGLARHFVPPISVVLAARRDAYVAGLVEYREGELERWLSFFAEVTATAADRSEELVTRIDALEAQWLDALPRRPRADAAVHRVLRMLPAHPVLNVATVQRALEISDVSAGNALRELERIGVIRQVGRRLRGRVWECPAMYDLMGDFEHALG